MRKSLLLGTCTAMAALMLSSCALSGSSSGVQAGSLAVKGNLDGVTLTVGSKEFSEQLVLCNITADALESAGATVNRSCGMSGTNSARSALTAGSIDMYWEYTGTGWTTHLQHTKPIADPRQQYEAVAEEDLGKNGIRWLEPSPANNTYAIAAPKEKADQLGVRSVSDYAALAKREPAKATFCGATEFFGRDDGWPGVQKAYGFDLDRAHTAELAAGAIYNAIDTANPCNFGEVFATDGRIPALGLTVLDDDNNFFVPYNPSLTVRNQVADQNPQIATVMSPVNEALTDETLRGLNAKVDAEGKTPEKVAEDWLREKKFVS